MKAMIDEKLVADTKARALTPDRPQSAVQHKIPMYISRAREAGNKFYLQFHLFIKKQWINFFRLSAASIIVRLRRPSPSGKNNYLDGSAADTTHETVDFLNTKASKSVSSSRLFNPRCKGHLSCSQLRLKNCFLADRRKAAQ